ncbi:MAG TPA: type II toxin-antitoxin system RelE/ParE family toxin [Chloroflexia bacterium]|jgi:addiction module RelE/StbE family toxin|nr:type II toxin-antitoxin system RelE/ParE family toxin [Chloroflexia bacterium]
MKIVWRARARDDLREAIQYLRQFTPEAALRTSATIRQKVTLLAEHPHLGRPGRVAGTRELVIAGTPYIVAYTVDSRLDSVVILSVLHGRRLWPEELAGGADQ